MIRKLCTVVVFAALTLGVIWLFQTPTPPAAKVAEAPKAVVPIAAKPGVKPQVAAPSVAPAVPQTAQAAPAKTSGDPQAELNSSLSDIVSLIQAGDYLTAFHRYIPPEMLAQIPAEEMAQIEQQLSAGPPPGQEQDVQMFTTVIQSMQTQTPTLNATGDKATYQVTDPSGRSTEVAPISFKKVDGKWYVDPESMGMRGM